MAAVYGSPSKRNTNTKSNNTARSWNSSGRLDSKTYAQYERTLAKMIANVQNAHKRVQIQRNRLNAIAKTSPNKVALRNAAEHNRKRAGHIVAMGRKQLNTFRTTRSLNTLSGPFSLRPSGRLGFHNVIRPKLRELSQRFNARNKHLPTQTVWTNTKNNSKHTGPAQSIQQVLKKLNTGESLNAWDYELVKKASANARARSKSRYRLMDWERKLLQWGL